MADKEIKFRVIYDSDKKEFFVYFIHEDKQSSGYVSVVGLKEMINEIALAIRFSPQNQSVPMSIPCCNVNFTAKRPFASRLLEYLELVLSSYEEMKERGDL
jgi:hypothetical protein